MSYLRELGGRKYIIQPQRSCPISYILIHIDSTPIATLGQDIMGLVLRRPVLLVLTQSTDNPEVVMRSQSLLKQQEQSRGRCQIDSNI